MSNIISKLVPDIKHPLHIELIAIEDEGIFNGINYGN